MSQSTVIQRSTEASIERDAFAHEALSQTSHALQNLWTGRISDFLNHCSQSFFLVSLRGTVAPGNTPRIVLALSELRSDLVNSVSLSSFRYQVQRIGVGVYAVYLISVPKEGIDSSNTRTASGTFIWVLQDSVLKLCHCNVATSVTAVAKDAVANSQESDEIQIAEPSGRTYTFKRSTLVFAKADHQYTIIHSTDGSLRMRIPLGEVVNRLPDVLVRIHRSYAVNPQFVEGLRSEMLYLTTGTKLPVPARHVREVREKLGLPASRRRCAPAKQPE